jgi:Major Facilitator Superfamily
MNRTYQFKPYEQPVMLGSPYNPDHPPLRMLAYGALGVLVGITGALGNALITVDLSYVQGSLGISAVQAAWLPAAYVMTNVCANLLLVKCRQQFGLERFVPGVLTAYALTALIHLLVHDFWSALLIRAASGIAAAGLSTLCILALMQAFTGPKRLVGVLVGISVPQLAIPIARSIAPGLLEWGDWRMTYFFELALAMITLAAVLALPMPPSDRKKVFERTDFLTVALIFPGVALLCSVLGLGKILWWTEARWIGWALVGAILLLAAGFTVEHHRSNALVQTRWLSRREIARLAFAAIAMRVLVSEQTFGAVGLLANAGMGTDQLQALFQIILLASIAGIVAATVWFRPDAPARMIVLASLFIAIGAFIDAGADNLTRPANLYFSQALVGFGALLFIGPAMVIGISRMLLSGPQNFVSWVVLFSATQNIGGQVGSALFGTFQVIREKFHSHDLVEQVVLTDPHVAGRFAGSSRQLGGVIADQMLQSAQGAALVARQVASEAQILAFNDVFLLIGVLASLALVWGISIELKIRRLGEPSPIVLVGQKMAAMAVAPIQEGKFAS